MLPFWQHSVRPLTCCQLTEHGRNFQQGRSMRSIVLLITYRIASTSSSFSARRRSASWRYWLKSAARRCPRCSSALRPCKEGERLARALLEVIVTRTYSFGFLVGSGQFITLVLQTTQLQFQFVQATVQLVDDALGLMQIIYRKELISKL